VLPEAASELLELKLLPDVGLGELLELLELELLELELLDDGLGKLVDLRLRLRP
jgi:hypothetical protein